MPQSLDLRRLVLPRTALAFALALVCACSDETPKGGTSGDDDSASEDDDSSSNGDDDSTSEEEEPRDAKVASKDSGPDAGSSRDSGGSSGQDAASTSNRDSGATPPRDAGGGTMDGGPVMVPVGDGSVSGIPEEELAMLRQVCVDEINRYRATLMLAPIMKASAQQELCSDQGAKKDGDTGKAHESSGGGNPCVAMGIRLNYRSQNTCPGYPVRRGTIADALKTCLKQMWDEGEPPQGEAQCLAEYRMGNTECFLAYGHWINMKGMSRGVSCGFYKMANGNYWMNQDFY